MKPGKRTLWIYYPLETKFVFKLPKEVERIMCNARYLSRFKRAQDVFSMKKVFLDSGGLLNLKEQIMHHSNITIDQLVETCKRHRPTLFLPVDFPSLIDMKVEEKAKRWRMTFNSLKKTLEQIKNTTFLRDRLVPVVHGFSEKSLKKVLYDKNVGIFNLADWDKIALGAQKPLLQKMYFIPDFGKIFCKTVILLRELIGDEKWLHILGAGGEKILALSYLLGANSSDSSSWYIAAVHGRVTIPCSGAHKLLIPRAKPRSEKTRLSTLDKKRLENCSCEVCRELDPNVQIKVLNDNLDLRLLHNLSVTVTQSKLLRQLDKKELISWIKETQGSSSLWPIFQYALQQISR